MSSRYFSRVASTPDSYTVVIAKGSEHGVEVGDVFLVVGLGDVIVDPDSGEQLEQLEIVRGRAKVTHVQLRVSTLVSCEYIKTNDTREIKKVTTSSPMVTIFGPQDTVTESITPGTSVLKELHGAQIGDFVIRT
ncbi:hypothetical protein [Pseudomonas koreensis]|uniref:hypothetical protein n=1 Tax=Pseudomonas koreensis TaxID=198620 RepID=UPI000FD987F1|nr:hypothetical protein [Pseudomonas koreensis]